MKRLILIVVSVLVLGVVGCAQKPAPAPTVTAPAPTVTAPTPTVTAPTPKPKGSVLEFKGDYLREELGEGYWGFQITARVQNLGDAGIITVFAEITPKDYAYEGRNWKTIEVYLRQGEEKQLNFHFWVKWPIEGLQYGVKTLN